MNVFEEFVKRFDKNADVTLPNDELLGMIQSLSKCDLPFEYIEFAFEYGDVWTPDILEIIVDNNLEMYSLQEFWTFDAIYNKLVSGWSSKQQYKVVPFANDSSGNIYYFKKETGTTDMEVFIYDFDFEEEVRIATTFRGFIEQFVEMPVGK